jgi:L-2-hydroxyglutarate oxidase LhgO
MFKKKVAIIGGGFYGCTAALILSKKYDVEIFEKENDILSGASKVNQFRFHRGYHYPRSQITIDQIKNSYKKFIKFFGNDVLKQTKNYYAVAKYKSMTSYGKFIQVLLKNKLFYKEVKNKKLFSDRIEGAIISNEKTLNYFKIKKK